MLIVSNYHYIREDFSAPYPSIFGLTPKQFQRQLEELAKYGSFISKEDLLSFRNRPFDRNYFLISFDDGLQEQFDLAKPILDRMGIPFLCFINSTNFTNRKVSLVHKIHLLRSEIPPEKISGALSEFQTGPLNQNEGTLAISHYNYDSEVTAILKYQLNFKMTLADQEEVIGTLFDQYFDEDQVAKKLYLDRQSLEILHSCGSLGSHSHTHVPLGQLTSDHIKEEINLTQDFFKHRFGSTSDAISYPYGSSEACTGISELMKEGGFLLGFTMERAANQELVGDSLMLARFDCNDLPMGKNDLFKGKNPFEFSPLRKWQLV